MQNFLKKRDSQKTNSFIGHAGAGARLKSIRKNSVIQLQEKIGSQLIIIFSLGLFSFYPLWILIYKSDAINGGLFGKSILGLTSLFSLPFFIKYSRRLFGQRRIEINIASQRVLFINEKKEIETAINFSEIKDLKIKNTDYYSEGSTTPNYTLIIIDNNSKIYELYTSEKKFDEIFEQLSDLISKSK